MGRAEKPAAGTARGKGPRDSGRSPSPGVSATRGASSGEEGREWTGWVDRAAGMTQAGWEQKVLVADTSLKPSGARGEVGTGELW